VVNLSVNIAGLELKNPFIVASSDNTRDIRQIKQAEECGASAVVLKAMLPPNSNELQSMLRVFVEAKKKLVYGTAGATRLTYDQGVELVRAAKKETKIKIGANIPLLVTEDFQVIVDGIKKIVGAGADFVELNYKPSIVARPAIMAMTSQRSSNIKEEGGKYEEYIHNLMVFVETRTRSVKQAVSIPVIAKLTPDGIDEVALAMAAERGGADAVDAIGSLGGAYNVDIFNNGRPRIPNALTGFFQISGAVLKPYSQAMVARISKAVNIPVIGTGGLTSWTDVVEMIMFGAHAVSFCTLFMIRGFEALAEIEKGLREFMEQQGFRFIDDFRGAALRYIAPSISACEFIPSVARVDQEKCTGCGICLKPAHCLATSMENGKAVVNEAECLGCGTCFLLCPAEAVSLVEIDSST
jgi:dihydropyrimidine dehydrogenase (NAD+) subunit PreA